MKKNRLLFIFMCCIWDVIFAANTNVPVYFVSDQAHYDLKTRQTTFLGHVVMKQGSDRLYADKIVTVRNKKGMLEKVIAYGKPANYLIYDKEKNLTNAKARMIQYYPDLKHAILIDHASIAQDNDKTLTGPHIVYDLSKHEIMSQSNSAQRTTITFMPDQLQKDQ